MNISMGVNLLFSNPVILLSNILFLKLLDG